MQRLSESLLRLARTGADLRDANIELVNLNDVAKEAAERMEPFAEGVGLALRVEGWGGPVWADREWLEQTLLIVVRNAIQHSERGDEVRLRLKDGAVIVEDKGSGISDADLPYVFERFYRGREASRKEGAAEGFGLGLAICKDLVERMGGSISLESEKGVGTIVEIELTEGGAGAKDTDS
jgi:signal transduction histidine kinase